MLAAGEVLPSLLADRLVSDPGDQVTEIQMGIAGFSRV